MGIRALGKQCEVGVSVSRQKIDDDKDDDDGDEAMYRRPQTRKKICANLAALAHAIPRVSSFC